MNKKITEVSFENEERKDFIRFTKEKNISKKDLNRLLELVDNTFEDEDELLLKITYHLKYHGGNSRKETEEAINDLIKNFDFKLYRYSVYRGYKNLGDWAEDYNNEYQFLDLKDYNEIYNYIDKSMREYFIRDLRVTIDLGELENRIFDIKFSDLLKELSENGILQNLPFDISSYINWERVIDDCINPDFIVESWFEDMIVVES